MLERDVHMKTAERLAAIATLIACVWAAVTCVTDGPERHVTSLLSILIPFCAAQSLRTIGRVNAEWQADDADRKQKRAGPPPIPEAARRE